MKFLFLLREGVIWSLVVGNNIGDNAPETNIAGGLVARSTEEKPDLITRVQVTGEASTDTKTSTLVSIVYTGSKNICGRSIIFGGSSNAQLGGSSASRNINQRVVDHGILDRACKGTKVDVKVLALALTLCSTGRNDGYGNLVSQPTHSSSENSRNRGSNSSPRE